MNLFYLLVDFMLIKINYHVESRFVENITPAFIVKGSLIQVFNYSVQEYLGIRYAKPPIGSLRFAKPQPIIYSNDTIDATYKKNSCRQLNNFKLKSFSGKSKQSEDCLFLNIWTSFPIESKLKSVMFWIHDGFFTRGSIFGNHFNGSILATHEVVVVTINYRLGAFGFLYGGDNSSAPGNVALYDILTALHWVRTNIEHFGGDKNQITISGYGAGGWSVSLLLLSPLATGLFNRAIVMSGGFMFNKNRPPLTKEEALESSKRLATRLNCRGDQWIKCLQSVKSKNIPLKTGITFPIFRTEILPFTPIEAFKNSMFNKDVDLLTGIIKDEGLAIIAIYFVNFFSIFFLFGNKEKHKNQFIDEMDRLFHNIDKNRVKDYYFKQSFIQRNILNVFAASIEKQKADLIGDLLIKCPTYYFAKNYARYSNNSKVYFYQISDFYQSDELPGFGDYHTLDAQILFGEPLLKPKTKPENLEFTNRILKMWTDFIKYGKPAQNWYRFGLTDELTEWVKDLGPNHKFKYFDQLFKYTCNGVWQDYFSSNHSQYNSM